MKLFELALYLVKNDVECLMGLAPYDLRYVSDLADAHKLTKALRDADSQHPNAFAHRFIITPLPRPEDHALPFCVHCGEPTADFAAHGQPWHRACFREWEKEYQAHLDHYAGDPLPDNPFPSQSAGPI